MTIFFPGTSKPLVNHNIFTNLDFLKSDLYLRVWANYWTICWGWGRMMTQGNSFATSHPCDVSAEFPQRAFWTPETWRDWVSKKIIFQTVGTSKFIPPTFFWISDPTKEVDTTGNWYWEVSLYTSWEVPTNLMLPKGRICLGWKPRMLMTQHRCWGNTKFMKFIDIMDIYRCFGWAIFLL